jgi:hypothetical protein
LLFFFFNEQVLANQCRNLLSQSSNEHRTHEDHVHSHSSHDHDHHGHSHHKNETIVKITQVLERLWGKGLIENEELFNRLKHELDHLNHEIEEKKEFEVFQRLFNKWTAFIELALQQFDNYDRLSDSDKEQWKDKLQLIGRFTLSQFVVFLEVEGRLKAEPVYKKQNLILSSMNALPEGLGFKIFSFELEKQIKRFFSVSEIKNCKFF